MKSTTIYDLAGIGIGPFNLGLAALVQPLSELNCIFFDSKPAFSWHPGLLFDFSKLQVPFFADLVTAAEPSSYFSYLSFLKRTGRLLRFAILEDNYITRKEYNTYCRWVADQLSYLRFGHTVSEICYNEEHQCYQLDIVNEGCARIYYVKRLVLGTGSIPYWPLGLQQQSGKGILHSADYLFHKEALLRQKSITIIGSGQSAAEIFYDLLNTNSGSLQINWITRASRFYAMEISKLSYEMSTPDYIDYFFDLTPDQKKQALSGQNMLYKGINEQLLAEIYKTLYNRGDIAGQVQLRTNTELIGIRRKENSWEMELYHHQQQKSFKHLTSSVVLATGYKRVIPAYVYGIKSRIQWDKDGLFRVDRNYSIDAKNEIYVQNAELHTHGFNAPDLGLGAYRNAVIINCILGCEQFIVEKKVPFQTFGC